MKHYSIHFCRFMAIAIIGFNLAGCGGTDTSTPAAVSSSSAATGMNKSALKVREGAILNVDTTSNALSEIKGLYAGRYRSGFFILQAGMFYQIPKIFTMYSVDDNPLDQFVEVDNDKLPVGYDFIYPSLAVNYDAGGGYTGTSYLSCVNKNGVTLMLDPNELLPASASTYITFTEAYEKSEPPYTMFIVECTCTGPACQWQPGKKRREAPFEAGTNLMKSD